ncbi:LOW QUALITY PROTEIN: hypothetical protein Cgig2_016941 [Carnegiea gigantea]|uniref:Uncharacterized protein n=1 Tax=Carnegiea gigantea TaxID=171969 RepID=A0A9Q1JQB9_9CARY|nr:LOW QUALITY PROTEIN: hypothetical protein Cgig2_016941 [Carnegiea gigantea]
MELALSCRIDMNCIMSVLRCLNWTIMETWLWGIKPRLQRAQIPYLVNPPVDPATSSGPVEDSGFSDAPLPSSDEGVLCIEEEVSYPWEITIAHFVTDFQAQQMAKTKSAPRVRTPYELLAEGTMEDRTSANSSLGGPSTSSSSDGTSASSSSWGAPSALGRLVLKKKGSTLIEPILEIVADGLVFPWALSRSDPQDGPSTHFSNPKATLSLKRTSLKKKYLLSAGYSFVIPDADALTDDRLRPTPKFMAEVIESTQGPEKRKSKSSDREPWNWLPRLKFFENDFFLATAKLTPFESGDSISEQIATKAEHPREEERARLVNVAAKKALGPQGVPGTPKAVQAASLFVEETPTGTRVRSTSFLAADSAAKLELVWDLANSLDLAALGTSEPPKVTENEVAMVNIMSERRRLDEAAARYKRHWEKLREERDTWEAAKKDLQGRLNEALSKAEAALAKAKAEAAVGVEKAAKAEELGYQRGREEVIGFLRKVLTTLAPDFQEDNYFEAYTHYRNANRPRLRPGPEEVKFIPPFGEGDEDEGTTPLDGEAGTLDDDGPGTSTTKKSTSIFFAFPLSPKRKGRRIIPVGFTSCPPKRRIGWTRGTMSLSGYVSFFRHWPQWNDRVCPPETTDLPRREGLLTPSYCGGEAHIRDKEEALPSLRPPQRSSPSQIIVALWRLSWWT